MYNEINKEEKLTKEERDILERNLEIFFAAIVKSPDTKVFDIEDIENKEIFLEKFSPWHQKKGKGQELIQKFVDIVNNDQSTEDFSWLDILDADKRWKESTDDKLKKEIKENKNKYINMRYQIPTHFHGDIDNAVLFYCMENPRGYIEDSDMDTWAEKQMHGKKTIDDYYKYTAKLRDETWKNETSQKIIKERYNLNDFTTDSIEKIIYSNSKDETPLRREIEHIYKQDENNKYYNFDFDSKKSKTKLLKDYYYFKEFYSQLIQTDQNLDFKKLKNEKEAVKEIADKICNVEIYPFSCDNPNLGKNGIGREILLKSDLSRLGAYIVLRRIYRYLINDKTDKPVIVLRKYSAWEELFNKILEEVKQTEQSFDKELVLSLLEKGFFYCQLRPRGGGITSGNVISVTNYEEYLNLKKYSTLTKLELDEKYLKMKDNAFKEISDLLPRIDIDKISAKESGNE